jgi:hypothetical protein
LPGLPRGSRAGEGDVTADLPARPSLDHLRRQARDLQLAMARGYGFASWTRLRDEVTARTASLARQAEAFCEASICDRTGRAARMLLDAGADPDGRTGEAGGHGGWTPLRCAVADAASPLITRLLLERGAVPGDHDLHLAGFAEGNHECLRLLLLHAADVAQPARMALAAPISLNDAEGLHLCADRRPG